MTLETQLFSEVLDSLKVDNLDEIHSRRNEITKALNKNFRGSSSTTRNRYYIGSFGRNTAIQGVSDLDLMYILPLSLKDGYLGAGGAAKALNRVRDTLVSRYPNTQIRVDQTIVAVQFNNFRFEVQPVFEDGDKYLRPDSHIDQWKSVNPSAERNAFKDINAQTAGTARKIARLVRAWKEHHRAPMNGLLIDTFVQRFLSGQESEYRTGRNPGQLMFDFFTYLGNQPEQDFYRAMGSGQEIAVRRPFQAKAKKAAKLVAEAIQKDGETALRKAWKNLFGKFVPASTNDQVKSAVSEKLYGYTNTEEFIEDLFPVELIYQLEIDCTVTQNGFRPRLLRQILEQHGWLAPRKQLDFRIVRNEAPSPFEIRWKVLNKGEEAYRKNHVRGQILNGGNSHHEVTSFRGRHQVECFVIKDGVVVARDKIDVPISANQ
ncbi:nucleotide-binding domain-containing protein [Corynebacterium rouxii]|uniref:nucleotide-binding domain-containing protein n=1 Tax=Corynebacterium rouxii TaxID=2719119 RepID=UPI00313BCC82